jgi:uncharacterized protein
MKQFTFDLQRFSEEDEGYTIDQALEVLNGTTQPAETEQQQEEVVEQVEEVVEQETQEEVVETPVEPPAVDHTLKVKFKANGQENDVTIAQLIEMAQKGSNYEIRMQEVSNKEKAFQTAMEQYQRQQQQQEQPKDPVEEWERRLTDEELRNPNFNRFDPAQTLSLMERVMKEEREAEIVRQSQEAVMQVEHTYHETVNSFATDPNHQSIYDYAVNAMYALPQKGKEGIQEFNEMYGIYQKVQQRDQYYADMERFGQSTQRVQPFTKAEVEKLTKFYNDCKADYTTKQSKDQVQQQIKAQVPKNVPIKPTVKVEGTSNGEPVPAKKVDFKKMQTMDLDEIAKML